MSAPAPDGGILALFARHPTAANLLMAVLLIAGLAALTLSPDQKAAFFAIPENRPLIEEISQRFPGGERGLIYRKSRPGEVLFEYYILAP